MAVFSLTLQKFAMLSYLYIFLNNIRNLQKRGGHHWHDVDIGIMLISYFINMKFCGKFQNYSRHTQPGKGRIAKRQNRGG